MTLSSFRRNFDTTQLKRNDDEGDQFLDRINVVLVVCMICGVDAHRTIASMLRYRSSCQPNHIAYRFLADDGVGCAAVTYRELDEAAQRVAAWVQSSNTSGMPIPLIFSAGLEFISAFYGCLYAENCVVPLSLPGVAEGASRIRAALDEVRPSVVLVASKVRERLHRELADESGKPVFDLVPFGEAADCSARWREPRFDGGGLALLQFTSGSVASPRGVKISHRNLLHNIGLMSKASHAGADSIGVSWLPHFHDMGLIGGILMPMYAGFPVTLMSPSSFVRRPIRWLETISKTQATISGAPNFGYEHCLREIRREDLHSLDLSSWRTAFSGAEPVRPATMARFSEKFAGAGFRKEALFPCYGLAEATLMVSGQHWSDASEQKFSRSSLQDGVARVVKDDSDCTALVSSGPVLEGHRVLIVDPKTGSVCRDGDVGEVWIDSESVGEGYWNRPDESIETFQARPSGADEGFFLKTGDLGFIWRGELFIAGRQKDLLIIRGVNFYPQDIERAIEAAVPTLRAGFGAAFTVECDREEKLVIVYELDKASREPNGEFDCIGATLARRFGLQVHAIALIKRNRIPRTTSGKIKRQKCRSDFVDGKLPIIAEWRNPAERERVEVSMSLWDIDPSEAAEEKKVGAVLREHIAGLLGIEADTISDGKSVYDLGIDSLSAAQLQNKIEQSLKVRLDVADLLVAGTIREIVLVLVEKMNDTTRRKSADLVDGMFERVLNLPDDEVARLLSLEEGAVRG
ncbi:AMP-binding protein [Bradyrhizobium roseum]|uniref:AMP-binding protein n=1 Tax=Bradyrhizobium roseum TaxID=3056648 RepID=UPI00262F3566|nr:AMP-binding protein [Bradyrhizobium roseus]WKA26402.1 AMP-binding protein [Bradyrhizobium roseus]